MKNWKNKRMNHTFYSQQKKQKLLYGISRLPKNYQVKLRIGSQVILLGTKCYPPKKVKCYFRLPIRKNPQKLKKNKFQLKIMPHRRLQHRGGIWPDRPIFTQNQK